MPPSTSRPARCSAGSPGAIGATEFRQFLAQIDRATPPELALHLTWFGQLERRAIRRGVFSQCDRTAPSLRRFIPARAGAGLAFRRGLIPTDKSRHAYPVDSERPSM